MKSFFLALVCFLISLHAEDRVSSYEESENIFPPITVKAYATCLKENPVEDRYHFPMERQLLPLNASPSSAEERDRHDYIIVDGEEDAIMCGLTDADIRYYEEWEKTKQFEKTTHESLNEPSNPLLIFAFGVERSVPPEKRDTEHKTTQSAHDFGSDATDRSSNSSLSEHEVEHVEPDQSSSCASRLLDGAACWCPFLIGKPPENIVFSEQKSEAILENTDIIDFLDSQDIKVDKSEKIGEGSYASAYRAKNSRTQVDLVYKEAKKSQGIIAAKKDITSPREFLQYGDLAAAKADFLPHLVKTEALIINVIYHDSRATMCLPLMRTEKREQTYYVPAACVTEFIDSLKRTHVQDIQIMGQLMEKAPGETLDIILKSDSWKRLPLKERLGHFDAIGQQAYQYFLAAYKQNFVYRDIKPENMLYDMKTKKLTIIDTGSATKLDVEPTMFERFRAFFNEGKVSYKTASKAEGGTRKYMVPSLMEIDVEYGPEVDAYSFAKVLLELFDPSLSEQVMGDSNVCTATYFRKLNKLSKKNKPIDSHTFSNHLAVFRSMHGDPVNDDDTDSISIGSTDSDSDTIDSSSEASLKKSLINLPDEDHQINPMKLFLENAEYKKRRDFVDALFHLGSYVNTTNQTSLRSHLFEALKAAYAAAYLEPVDEATSK